MSNNHYDESSITVLKGLEPVRQRPGMYTRIENPMHIIQEVVDNAVDEALGGYANEITVKLDQENNLITITDNGRGIPTGNHPTEKIPVVELVFTKLHAGGKFNKGKENSGYDFSGGLHGVGVSVTNALSKKIIVESNRNKEIKAIEFNNGKTNKKGVYDVIIENNDSFYKQNSGTKVIVEPDTSFFDSPEIPVKEFKKYLNSKSVLVKNLKITFEDNKEKTVFFYPDGINDYLKEMIEEDTIIGEIYSLSHFIDNEETVFNKGEGIELSLAWTDTGRKGESYVNTIHTPLGGTHENGLKQGLYESIKKYIENHGMLPKNVSIISEDVWSNIKYVLSTKILDPQFQGQTKDKLISREALKLVSNIVGDMFDHYLLNNQQIAKELATFIIEKATNRQKIAFKPIEKKKTNNIAILPGKLTDCESENLEENEIFIVEGDSAGGSAKLARNKKTQAVLPLKGKILNTWEYDTLQLYNEKGEIDNEEIKNLSIAIGLQPHTIMDVDTIDKLNQFDSSNLRYGKIIIESDADNDGLHIQSLALTLFLKHMPYLLLKGHIYIAQPPLFRIDIEKMGKNPMKKIYALDETEKENILKQLFKKGYPEDKIKVSRFKGLGEMNPDQLKETTMQPETRKLVRVKFGIDNIKDSIETFDILMGKKSASKRKDYMEEKGII